MLAGGDDAGYRRLLRSGGGEPVRRVEVWRSGVRIDTFGDRGLTVLDGSVSATLASQVTRTVNFRVPADLFPWRGGDLLDPLGSEVRIWAGWRAGARAPWVWPVFRGPIVRCSVSTSDSGVEVECSDRAEMILADNFPSPRTPVAGDLVTSAYRDLVTDTLPDAVFGTLDETYVQVPQATWDSSRSQALDDLAAAAGCHWYSLAGGEFTLRRIPWAQLELGNPVVTLTNPGQIKSATVETGRDGVYNQVVLTAEPKDGSPPVYGSASDEDPTSRTYIRGPLGRRVLVADEPAAVARPQASTLARQRLLRTRTQVQRWSTSIVADPSLELGDVCVLQAMGQSVTRALVEFELPLVGEMVMTAAWRGAGEMDG